MATIVIHAGMPKAGSSAIQRWIRENAPVLHADLGVRVLVFRRRTKTSDGGLQRYESGSVNSGALWFRYLISDRDPAVVRDFVRSLARFARDEETVLLTSEALATPLAELNHDFIEGLNVLANEHSVRIAYYVRAQHESIEAAWRQWGFRSNRSPADYARFRQRLLDYDETHRSMARMAPLVSFEPRLFSRDNTHPTELINDFSQTFLPTSTPAVEIGNGGHDNGDGWVNAGLPLEVVNVLRHAPEGWFWDSRDDNRRLGLIKSFFAGVVIDESPGIGRSRELLRAHCYERFEEGNRRLAADRGWGVDHLIPTPAGIPDEGELDELDELWAGSIPRSEHATIFALLRDLIGSTPAAETRSSRDELAEVLDRFGARAAAAHKFRT